jgi:hypothetical protein
MMYKYGSVWINVISSEVTLNALLVSVTFTSQQDIFVTVNLQSYLSMLNPCIIINHNSVPAGALNS